MMDKLAHFLSSNSWIVVIGAILTFFPIIKWFWLRQSDASIWLANESRYDTEDVKLAANSPSYFVSQLIKNAENFGFFVLISAFFLWISSLFSYRSDDLISSSAKALSTLVGMVIVGAAFVTLIRTSYFSRSVAEVAKRAQTGGKKK